MKKFIALCVLACLFASGQSIVAAKEEAANSPKKGSYHAIDYEVAVPHKASGKYQVKATLPTSYDARKEHFVTSVKDQNPYGDCWAFSAMATAETSALKNRLVETPEGIDLSELQFAYRFYHRVNDPLQNTANDANIAEETGALGFLNNGGNNWTSAFALSQWISPTDEKNAPHAKDDASMLNNIKKANAYEPEYIMKDAIFLPDEDIAAIKEAVITYGAVSTSFSAEDMGYYTQYYYNGKTSPTHAITIVGYDDSIAKEKFPQQPSKNGAWIVKNSWSSNANVNGYFYLSYEQPLNASVAYSYMPDDKYENNYFYDGTAGISSYGYTGTIVAANVYQAKKGTTTSPEYIEAVSVGFSEADTDYTIRVYTNLKDKSNPFSGTMAYSAPVKGYKKYSGIYTIPLESHVLIKPGTHYAVVVSVKNRYNDKSGFYVAKDRDHGWVKFNEQVNSDQSFLYYEGYKDWLDVSNSGFCFRIKALTTQKEHYAMNHAQATLSASSYTYDGKAHTPTVKLTHGSKTLVRNYDYRLIYSNTTAAGTGKIRVEGLKDYVGYKDITYQIKPRSLSDKAISVSSIPAKTYSGVAQKPIPIIKYGTTTLKNNVDYTLAYANNVKAGTASIIIKGKGNYSGTLTKYFTIGKRHVNTLSVGSITTKTYNKAAQKPIPTIKYGSITLKNGVDYTLTYTSNVHAGTAKVTITGKGSCSGSRVKYFTIAKRNLSTLKFGSIATKTYTGKAQKPIPSVKYGTTTLKNGTHFTLAYSNNTNPGTAKLTIKGKGDYTGSVTRSFKINKRSITTVSISKLANKTYTGKTIHPSVTVKYGGKTLKKNKDYTLRYGKNLKCGKAYVSVSGKGNYSSSITKTFYIVPKQPTSLHVKGAKSKYRKAIQVTYKKASGASGTQIAYRLKGTSKWKYIQTSKSSYIIRSLSSRKNYQVKLRSYVTVGKTRHYGSWTSTRAVKTK